jgi:hypothetical protein
MPCTGGLSEGLLGRWMHAGGHRDPDLPALLPRAPPLAESLAALAAFVPAGKCATSDGRHSHLRPKAVMDTASIVDVQQLDGPGEHDDTPARTSMPGSRRSPGSPPGSARRPWTRPTPDAASPPPRDHRLLASGAWIV